MNKKLFFGMFAASAMMLATSCSNDDIIGADGDMMNVSFNLCTEGANASRAISDGTGADYLKYAVFKADGTQLTELTKVETGLTDLKTGHVVNMRLAKGQSYTVVFWAQDEDCDAYTVSDDMNLSINYEGVNNDETRDAFFKAETITVTEDKNYTIELTRPFAQVNVGTADAEDARKSGIEIAQSSMTFQNIATKLNLLTGEPSNPTNISYSFGNVPTENLTVAGSDYTWLSMCYLLPNHKANSVTGKSTFVFKPNTGNNITLEDGLDNTPIQRNYRTNIVGNILTNQADFTIIIDNEFEEPSHIIALPWDGASVETPAVVNDTYVISNAAQFAWLNKRTIDKNVELAADIDLGGNAIYTMRINGVTFDGKNHTISNYVQNYMYYGNYAKGLFTGELTNGNMTIKNLTIDNAYVYNQQMHNGEGGFAGIIISDTQGNNTYTIENVHVQNSFVKGVLAVGGIVGFHGSQSQLNIKDCSVKGTTIANQAVKDESGFVGGLIGRKVGNAVVENSTVEECQINGYYASRRGENSINGMYQGASNSGRNNTITKTLIDDAVFVSSVADFASVYGQNVFLTQDIDCAGTTITPIVAGEIFDGNGFILKNVSVATSGHGYAAALLNTQSPRPKQVVRNLNIDGYTAPVASNFAAVICADAENGMTITIENVNINNATVRSAKAAGGFVGYTMKDNTQATAIIKNCSISNSNIYGMESRSAVVLGRPVSSSYTIEGITISNVKLNDVVSTKLVGNADV